MPLPHFVYIHPFVKNIVFLKKGAILHTSSTNSNAFLQILDGQVTARKMRNFVLAILKSKILIYSYISFAFSHAFSVGVRCH